MPITRTDPGPHHSGGENQDQQPQAIQFCKISTIIHSQEKKMSKAILSARNTGKCVHNTSGNLKLPKMETREPKA